MRRLCVPVALALLLLALTGRGVGAASLARATAQGWWDNAPAVVADPPQGALGVGQSLGQVDRVAALAVAIDVPRGAALEALILEVKEVSSQVVAGPAVLVACPGSAAWKPAMPGPWDQRPQAACDRGKAVGTRTDDGLWRFDITTIVQGWQSGAPNHGLVFLPEGASPATFDVALAGMASGGISFDGRVADPTDDSPSPSPAPEPSFDAPPADDGSALPPPSFEAPRTSPLPTTPALLPSSPTSPVGPAPVSRPQVGRSEGELGNLQATMLLLIPLALAAAAVLAVVLGPAGDPRGRRRREGGVSRALAARESEVK